MVNIEQQRNSFDNHLDFLQGLTSIYEINIRSRSHLSLPLPPPPPPMLGGPSAPPPPPPSSGLPLPPVLGQLSPSTPMPVTSPADVIKKQFLDCGETNDFHRLTRAGDTKNIKNMASNDPDLINSRGKIFNFDLKL